jgi:hypothetical protein
LARAAFGAAQISFEQAARPWFAQQAAAGGYTFSATTDWAVGVRGIRLLPTSRSG